MNMITYLNSGVMCLFFEKSSVLLKTLECRDGDNQYFGIIDRMVEEKIFVEQYRVCANCKTSVPNAK